VAGSSPRTATTRIIPGLVPGLPLWRMWGQWPGIPARAGPAQSAAARRGRALRGAAERGRPGSSGPRCPGPELPRVRGAALSPLPRPALSAALQRDSSRARISLTGAAELSGIRGADLPARSGSGPTDRV